MSESQRNFPLFPLSTVLFPDTRLPLQIFEPRYIDLVRDCMRTDQGFGLVAIREGREAGAAATPWHVGTLARIVDWDQGANGLLNILVEGSKRFDIVETRVGNGQLVVADVVWREPLLNSECAHAFGQLKALVENLLEKNSASSDGWPLLALEQPDQFVYTLLDLLPLPLALKVEFLDINETAALVDAALELLRALNTGKSHH